MHDTLRRLHGGARSKGTTIDRFRLNELMSQIAFGGRRGRVYQRIVTLSGVRPGDSVLDVGSSSGYLARKLAAAAGPAGHVTAVDPSEAAIGHARRGARPPSLSPSASPRAWTARFLIRRGRLHLAIHHIPARKREAAFREMYRVTKPGGRLLVADFDPSRPPLPLHPGGQRMRHASGTVGPLEELAATARYQVQSGLAAPAAVRRGRPA